MIDGGLRPSRPNGRQVAYRSESVRRQPEEPQYAEQAAPVEPPRQQEHSRHTEPTTAVKSSPRFAWVKWAVIALVVAALAVSAWIFRPNEASVAATIDTGKYQAVFLSNGQVYFGRLSVVNSEFMKLTNVFYLERQLTAGTDTESETNTNEQPTSGDNNFQLLKYSDVLYGSEDAMIISKDDIIRFENLRSDGVVAKAIANRR